MDPVEDQAPLLTEKADDEIDDKKSIRSLESFLSTDPKIQFQGVIPKDGPKYTAWFQFQMFMVAITAGLLQGYQVGIVAGIELYLPEEYTETKVNEDGSETTQQQDVSTKSREFFVSLFAAGAAFGCFFGGQLCDQYGRRGMAILGNLIIGGGFFVIILTSSISLGWIGRSITGLGSGVLSFAVPLYLNEVGSQEYNKLVIACYTYFTGVGMFGGLNFAILVRHHWRILFVWGFVPVGLQILLMILLPESQAYYMNKGLEDEARDVLLKGMNDQDALLSLSILKYEKQFFVSEKVTLGKKYSDVFRIYTKPLMMSLALAFFAQAVGTSAFLYYGSEIFMMTQSDVDGIDEHEESAVILDDFIIGAFIFGNLLSAFLIYKVGRKKIMLFSLPITLVSLLILAYTMRESNYGDENDESDGLKQAYRHTERTFFIIVIVIYTLSVSIGLSTTVLGITAEILPSYLLSTGSSLTQSFGWVFNFLINTFFLDILDDQQGRWIVFLVLAGNTALAILFVIFVVPETVGKSAKENLNDMLGREYLHKQRKILRKQFDILDIEIKVPEIMADMDKKKNAYKMGSLA